MAHKKTNAELIAENRLLRRTKTVMAVASTANTAIRWGGIGWIAWCMYLSIDSLAGKTTAANVFIQFISSVTISKWLAFTLAGGAVLYGVKERRLRQKTIERLQSRIQTLEATLDPNRTSSKLTERGETHPRDRE